MERCTLGQASGYPKPDSSQFRHRSAERTRPPGAMPELAFRSGLVVRFQTDQNVASKKERNNYHGKTASDKKALPFFNSTTSSGTQFGLNHSTVPDFPMGRSM